MMNVPGIIKGGLLGGVLIAISHYVLHSIKAGHEGGEGSIAFLVFYSLGIGILTAYLYAAARPRWGPGFKSAANAGIFVWTLHELAPALGLSDMGVAQLDIFHLVWSGVEMTIVGIVVGALYSES